MNDRQTARAKIAARLANETDEQVAAAYGALRHRVVRRRMTGAQADRNAVNAMLLTGDVLEARIGEAAFDALVDQLDAGLAA